MTSNEEKPQSATSAPDKKRAFSPNTIYLFKETRASKAYVAFQSLLEEGYMGLLITRSPLVQAIEKHGLGKVQTLWLTGNKALDQETLPPNEIGRLVTVLTKFIMGNGNGNDTSHVRSVILFDNIEYLIMQNNYQTMLRVLHLLRDKIMIHPAILLIPIDPLSLDPRELRLFEKECEVVDE
jgi:two-component system cell cycle response regulator